MVRIIMIATCGKARHLFFHEIELMDSNIYYSARKKAYFFRKIGKEYRE
ncbi:MAG: hypothetical protein K2P54_00285 [Odoribacter sp.]|nr:hypothetical protein [Odoribacter sp.]